MDSRTGDLYQSREQAIAAGVPEPALVQLEGTPESIAALSEAVRAANRGVIVALPDGQELMVTRWDPEVWNRVTGEGFGSRFPKVKRVKL